METVKFGSYKQGKSGEIMQIEWLILERKENKALLLSKYIIDAGKYYKDWADTTWQSSTIRQWLNNDFLSEAFSEDEIKKIETSNVPVHKNPCFNMVKDAGEATNDRIFLLSIDEASKYLTSNDDRKAAATEFLEKSTKLGEYRFNEYNINDKTTCWWWLRTYGYFASHAMVVDVAGEVYKYGEYVSDSRGGIRPAMWVNL